MRARALCHRWSYDTHRVSEGQRRPCVYGGLQILIDMSGAFDRVDRAKLHESFVRLGLPSDLICLFMVWHTHTTYVAKVWEALLTLTEVFVRDVRAPNCWSCLMWPLFEHIASRHTSEWALEACTFYADDGHMCCLFQSHEELLSHLEKMGGVLDLLKEFGMHINPGKSSAMWFVAPNVSPC